ncbi:unnamed protein product [Microthlaspi erraticum]|uniref:KIB1-4 beta-propeller domain-containing protein n=1 Tax=Microthlaspi erraticum TaxID=1685480 RepID=A0A6D2IZB2_9BRAS|nr:unnamed protein product [Microthlaspi erraticum]
MAPRKKTPTMKWVVKSQQSAKIAQPATKEQTILSTSDWSLLPEDLLHVISLKVEDRIDAIHARSVCSSWRSVFPFPSSLLSTSYSLPSFSELPRKRRGLCTLEKCPMFLFKVRSPTASPCEIFLGGIRRDELEEELPSPIQCSVKVKIKESKPTLMNMLDCKIFPLGHHYRILGWNPGNWRTGYRGVAFLPLNKDGRGGGGGGEFAVLISYSHDLFVLRSSEMKWARLEKPSVASCKNVLSFRGRFYAVFRNGDIFIIDPYSLEATPLLLPRGSRNNLVPSGNDELFLVEKLVVSLMSVSGFLSSYACRVRRLDEEAGKWVVVTHLGDRVLFINEHLGNVCFSGKDLPDGCGVTGNSIVFNDVGIVTYSLKYGVHTGREENDDRYLWNFSTEDRVTILHTSPVVALRVERASP